MKFIMTLALLLCSTSCLVTRAEDNVLIPAMQSAWPGVRDDIEMAPAGLEVPEEILDRAETAIMTGNRSELRLVNWPPFRSAALAGIQERINIGQISEGVAVSLRERLDRFTDAITRFQLAVPVAASRRPLSLSPRTSWSTSPPPAIAERVWK